MTREEAIKYAQKELKAAYERAEKIGHKGKTRYIEVLEMAIKALKKKNTLDVLWNNIERWKAEDILKEILSEIDVSKCGDWIATQTVRDMLHRAIKEVSE